MQATPIRSEIDLDSEGKHTGFLRLPHSVHRSAYGWIPIPVASIKRRNGPAVLVMAGNHGDEYEGQILVAELIRELDAGDIQGQLILLPMANYPAAAAGLRTSPLDNGNLNRSFPGKPTGSPTAVIAHFIEEHLLPRVQVVIDLHSGGSSLLYEGGNLMMLQPRDVAETQRVRHYAESFGMPRTLLHQPNPPTIAAAARRQNAISMITELGGAGTVSPRILDEARHGVLRFLSHIGLLQEAPMALRPTSGTRFMRTDLASHWVYARERGVYEPLAELGAWVEPGQPAARLHFPDTPWRTPVDVSFEGAGELVCRRPGALVDRGDCLFQLADVASL